MPDELRMKNNIVGSGGWDGVVVKCEVRGRRVGNVVFLRCGGIGIRSIARCISKGRQQLAQHIFHYSYV